MHDEADTTPELARLVVAAARLQVQQHVLEPSAGHGSLVIAMLDACPKLLVDAIESDHRKATKLRLLAAKRKASHDEFFPVLSSDFLALKPEALNPGGYDRIVMHPPFARMVDLEHVVHAWSFLKPGGRLVAVMRDREKLAFNAEYAGLRARVSSNEGVIAMGVRAKLIVFDKEA